MALVALLYTVAKRRERDGRRRNTGAGVAGCTGVAGRIQKGAWDADCRLKRVIDNVRYGDLVEPLIPMGNGSHETALAWADTTAGLARVLVKRLPLHELVREVLCNLLAQAVALPVPVPYVLNVKQSPWSTPTIDHVFGTGYSPGRSLARASRDAPATGNRLLGWPAFLKAIAFDEWIANGDRTASNLLYMRSKDFQLIDHGEALPNPIGSNTKLANRLARHLVASNTTAHPQDLSQRVLASCANFGTVNFDQIEVAALSPSWGGEETLHECIRLLKDRITHLPMLVEEEFRVNQGQLLA